MKKIIYVIGSSSPYSHKFFNILCSKVDLEVFYQRKGYSNRSNEWTNVLKSANYRYKYLKGIGIGDEIAVNFGILRLILKERKSLFIISDYYSPTSMMFIFLLALLKHTVILHIDGGIIREKEPLFVKLFKRRILSKATYFLSSGYQTDKYIDYYTSKKIKKYHYCFSSVDKSLVLETPYDNKKKIELRKELCLNDDCVNTFLVVFVGSFILRKGVDILINAAAKMGKEVYFLLIGGVPTDEIKIYIKKRQIENITFIDYVESETVKLYLRAADLFVFPTRYDIWGLVVNESLAAGVPVITTNKCVAGLELIKEGKNGYIVPTDNIDEVVSKISYYKKLDVEEKKKMQHNCLETARKNTIDNMADSYVDALIDIEKGECSEL